MNLTSIDYPSSTDITLTYDELNRLTNMVDATGTNKFAYTNLDLLSEDGPWASDTVTYTNANRRRIGLNLAHPTGSAFTESYAYDSMARLTNLTSGAGSFGYKYPSQPPTLHSQLSLPGGSYVTNTYDGNARLLITALKNAGGTVLNSHGYQLNVGNQRTAITNFYGNTNAYTYDDQGQLLSAVGKDAATNRLHEQFGYKYDFAGNLQAKTNNALVHSFVVNNLNQLSNVTRSGTLTVAGSTLGTPNSATVNGSNAALYWGGAFAATNFTPADGWNTYTARVSNSTASNTNTLTAWLPATRPSPTMPTATSRATA